MDRDGGYAPWLRLTPGRTRLELVVLWLVTLVVVQPAEAATLPGAEAIGRLSVARCRATALSRGGGFDVRASRQGLLARGRQMSHEWATSQLSFEPKCSSQHPVAHQLLMIASSRKKTDKRDAYWIAKALASGMTPHPVYIADAKVRMLRSLLSIRKALKGERNRWQMRARSALKAAGVRRVPRSGGHVAKMRMLALSQLEGLDAHLDEVPAKPSDRLVGPSSRTATCAGAT